jgi:DNA-binding MarR family transcriptional regulator
VLSYFSERPLEFDCLRFNIGKTLNSWWIPMAKNVFDDMTEPLERRLIQGLTKITLALKSQSWKGGFKQGMSPTQGQVLGLLRARADRGMRLAELAELLGISSATASEAVSTLERKGLVSKQRAASDSRVLSLQLTSLGAAESEKSAQWPDFLLNATGELSPSEQQIFYRVLIKMIRTLQLRGEIPVSRMCVTCQFFRPNVYPNDAHPHFCAYVNSPFGEYHLRIDCNEHQVASMELQQENWRLFTEPGSV